MFFLYQEPLKSAILFHKEDSSCSHYGCDPRDQYMVTIVVLSFYIVNRIPNSKKLLPKKHNCTLRQINMQTLLYIVDYSFQGLGPTPKEGFKYCQINMQAFSCICICTVNHVCSHHVRSSDLYWDLMSRMKTSHGERCGSRTSSLAY